ncbi:MAG: hypothetical protein ACT4O1_03440 [Gemmatimonadota bacterium]
MRPLPTWPNSTKSLFSGISTIAESSVSHDPVNTIVVSVLAGLPVESFSSSCRKFRSTYVLFAFNTIVPESCTS